MRHPTARRWLTPGALLGALALVLGILACAIAGQAPAAVQGWWSARGPVVPHDTFPADCSLCHEGGDWNTIKQDFQFDHEKETGVALAGAHSSAECLRCHNDRGPVAMFAQRGCSGCHVDPHQDQLGHDCQACHQEHTWRPVEQIAMHNATRFPLIGAHAGTGCFACHPRYLTGQFVPTPTECIACHQSDLAQATSPDHQANGWVNNCNECHIPTTWKGGGFNHSTWPLTGKHKQTSCTQCHVGGVYAGTPRNCDACHIDDYNATTDPPHAQFNIPTTCQDCHNTNSWQGAQFDHTGITNGCVNCHLSDYNGANDPNHIAAGFPTTCETCHDTISWNHGTFNHTQFPIDSGKHKNFSCNQCHLNPQNYTLFSCTHCHEHNQSKMNGEHRDVNGYVWQSNACYACHPDGQADD